MRSIVPIAFGLVFVAGTACAGGDSAQKFKQLDADASGAIERAELQAHPEAIQQFSQADANANGKLEMAEFAQLEISEAGASSSTKSTTPDPSSSQSPSSYPPQ